MAGEGADSGALRMESTGKQISLHQKKQSRFGGAQKLQEVGTPHPGEHASRRCKHTGLGFAKGILALDGRVRPRGL